MQVYPQPIESLQKIGDNFVNFRTIPNGVTTLVAPGANLNGLIIRTLHMALDSETNASIFISSSAPSDAEDTTKRSLVFYWGANVDNLIYPFQLFVPAGEGIYVANSPAGGRLSLTYDFLL